MFAGICKNIGGGFRVGVGTRIGGRAKKPSGKEARNAEFSAFIDKVQKEFDDAINTFVQANGYNLADLIKENANLNEVFANNSDYETFMSTYLKGKETIEKILFAGDTGVVAKRQITDEVFKLKEYISNTYPNFEPATPPSEVKKTKALGYLFNTLLTIGIIFAPYVFSWVT